MCWDALSRHGALVPPFSHPLVMPPGHLLLPVTAHRRMAKQEGDTEEEGSERSRAALEAHVSSAWWGMLGREWVTLHAHGDLVHCLK